MNKCIPVYPHPILLIENFDSKKYLVFSDIHIGIGDILNRKGIQIDEKKNVEENVEIINKSLVETKSDNLIILGDLKSSIKLITRSEWSNVPYFIKSLAERCNIYLVPGNHDGNINHLLPEYVNLVSSKGIQINNLLLTHGHTIPKIDNNIKKIVTGHLHPTLRKNGSILNGQKVWIRVFLMKNEKISNDENIFKNDIRKIEFIIMPHFNKYLDQSLESNITFDQKNVKKKPKLPLLDNLINKKKWVIENVYFYSLEGSIIGSEEELYKIL